jgi:hypothetical protein
MKKYLVIFSFFLSLTVIAQEDQWVNRISFNTTANCIDSLTCYTQIAIEINKDAIPDSAKVTLIIGSTPGTNDIYSKRFQYVPSIYNENEVSRNTDGNPVFILGEYIVTEQFYVDVFIE